MGNVSGKPSASMTLNPWNATASKSGVQVFLCIKIEVIGGTIRSAIRSVQNR
jgi:hypothetical protein